MLFISLLYLVANVKGRMTGGMKIIHLLVHSVDDLSAGWLQLLYVSGYQQWGGGKGLFSLLRLACMLFVCLSTHI